MKKSKYANFVIALSILLLALPVRSEDQKHACLSEIEVVFDEIGPSDSIVFCESFRSGWKFRIITGLNHTGISTEGSALRLFNFRQPNWRRGDPNRLEFDLVLHDPNIPNLYEIHLRVGEKTHDRSGKRTYFLWGRDIRTPLGDHGPYGSKWNPVRFIRCLTLADHGCVTYYNVIVCKRYRSPTASQFAIHRPMVPLISISTDTPETSEDLLKNFHLVHNLVEEALERLMEHSCT